MRKIWTAAWKIGLFLLVWAAFYVPLFIPVALRGGLETPFVRLYAEVTGAATILAAAWILQRFVDHRSLMSLGFAPHHAARDLGAGLIIGAAMMASCIAIFMMAGWARWLSASISLMALWPGALSMMANTITQEVLVRGYVRQTFEREFGVRSAILLSAIFFVVLHAGAIRLPLPALNLFAAGLLLGAAYAATSNLWLPIGIHFTWNFLQGPLLGLPVSGQSLSSGWRTVEVKGPPAFTGGSFGVEGGLVALVITTIAAAITASRIAPDDSSDRT
ncbi:MAG TPA: type II CAAX endopeptidase family protein [Thermoanaerobaculia bacterium]